MRQPIGCSLLASILIGFFLLGPGNCTREETQSTQSHHNDNITPSPLVGSTDGWRPVVPSGDTVTISARSHNPYSQRHVNEPINRHPIHSKPQQESINTHPIHSKLQQESINGHPVHSKPQQESINRHPIHSKPQQESINRHPVHSKPQHEPINRHPVLGKLQLHMESAEKAKLKRYKEEAFFSTTPNILGSFSSFGHATVRSREPAVTKYEGLKAKQNKHKLEHNYQVTESINEYSLHLVPPPVHQTAPARFPDMADMRKPHPGYRYPKPDMMVEEQRHVYFLQSPPPRPQFLAQTHTPKPPGYFYGGPQIPNFAGINTPHHYPGALAGALLPGPDSIRYFQRPDSSVHNSGGNQYKQPTSISLDAASLHGDNRRPQQEHEQNDQVFRRPDPTPFKNSLRQEEFVTGRPSHEVRGPENNSFTVGSSFLAGNKHEDNMRPLLSSQNTGPQQFYNGHSLFPTSAPSSFEQAFETRRPGLPHKEAAVGGLYKNPTETEPNSQDEKTRIMRPFLPEDATSVQHVQITGPSSTRHHQFDSAFPPGVVEDVIQDVPHFLPTVTSDAPSFPQDHSSSHINEVHHSLNAWSQQVISSPERVVPVELEVQTPSSVREEPTTVQGPVLNEVRPVSFKRPATTAAVLTTTHTRYQVEESEAPIPVHRQKETVTSLPFENESTTEELSPQITTEQPPVVSEQEERRPQQAKRPTRYRTRPTTNTREEENNGSQHIAERPHRRPVPHRNPSNSVDNEKSRRPSEDLDSPNNQVRQKQRRRRPQPVVTPEVAPSVPTVEDDSDDKYNHVSYNEGHFEEHHTTTPRPRRRKPYNRGQERPRTRTTTTEFTPTSETVEPHTVPHVPDETTPKPSRAAQDYSVYEEDQESGFDSPTQGSAEESAQETTFLTTTTTSTTTTTTTTTPPPTTTPTPTPTTTPSTTPSSRYKPRVRYGTNSTRPRFSVKDYKDRLNRLPKEPKEPKEPKNEEAATTPTVTELPPKMRYPSRVRGPFRKPDEQVNEEEINVPATTVESLRNKYRPKFGAGNSRYRTTTSSPAQEDSTIDKSESKQSPIRVRLPPTGKYYSRYRSTTETPIEDKIDTDFTLESPSVPKMKPKSAFSPRLRFPSRAKYGSHNEISTTIKAESSIAESANKEDESVTSTTDSSTDSITTSDNNDEETKTTLSDMFTNFEETSKSVEKEYATKATKTYMFKPTMPSTFQYDFESHTKEPKTSSPEDGTEVDSPVSTAVTDVVDLSDVDTSSDQEVSPSQRVADLTSAATSGGYFNTMVIARRKPLKINVDNEDPVLPIEAFFTSNQYHKE